jgi:tetratricopeptide (TPR) repeat protein
MVIIYGVSHLCKKRKVTEWATCPHCQAPRMLRSYSALEWLSLFYIPVFPMGTVRAVFRCPSCNKFYKFVLKGKKLAEAVAEARAKARAQVAGDREDVVADVAMLAHLGDFEGIEELVGQLRQGGHEAMAATADGCFCQLQGRLAEAEAQYRQAVQADGSNVAGHYWLGRFLLEQSKDEEAVGQLRQVPADDPEYGYLGLLDMVAERRRRRRNWDGLVTILKEMERLSPELAADKKFAKRLAKACRKSGRMEDGVNPYAMR